MVSTHFVKRLQCPGCHHPEATALYARPFSDPEISDYLEAFYGNQGHIELEYLEQAVYQLMACNQCGLVYQSEIPGDFLMNKLYEEWINPEVVQQQEEADKDLTYRLRDWREIVQLIDWLGQDPGSLSFFDFGMGWADWCKMAAAFGVQAYGTELSETRIANAKAHGIEVIHWDDIPGQNFDVINTEQVFEHIPQPLDTLIHLKKGLAPKGLLKVSVPEGGDIRQRMQKMDWQAPKGSPDSLNAVAPLEHINCFSYEAIIQMGKEAGMEPVSIPMATRYRFLTDWKNPTALLKNLIRPFYESRKKGAYVWLRPIS